MNKTLLFHDTFLMKWWAERMNIEIAKILDADIWTAYWSRDCYDARSMGYNGEIMEVNSHFRRGMLGFILMKLCFVFSGIFYRKKMEEYGAYFFSNEAISAIWLAPKGKKTYYYAHSIARHLFDQYEQYLAKVPKFLKPLYKITANVLRRIYKAELQKVWTIFVNSQKNKERMKEWIGRDDAIVLSPPVDTKKFKKYDENTLLQMFAIEWITWYYKDYYISFSRLTHAKRIDVIIEAFKEMPDRKLLIIYGRNDPQRAEFFALAEWCQNIQFRILTDNEHLPYIIQGALATIAVSKDEDFGMVAIESMACGIPVIAVDQWGYQESIIRGQTWFLLPEEWIKENIKLAVGKLTKWDLEAMWPGSLQRAQDFSLTIFSTKLLTYLQ